MSMIDVEKAIGTAVKTGKVVLGAESAVKNAQSGKARLIMVAANCPAEVRGDIEYYSKLSGVNVVVYRGTSIDLGMACRKSFMVSALTVKEPGDSDILRLIEQPSVEGEEEAEEEVSFGAEEEFEEVEEEDVQADEEDTAAEELSAEDDEDMGEEVND